jgi:hypothetical protein
VCLRKRAGDLNLHRQESSGTADRKTLLNLAESMIGVEIRLSGPAPVVMGSGGGTEIATAATGVAGGMTIETPTRSIRSFATCAEDSLLTKLGSARPGF